MQLASNSRKLDMQSPGLARLAKLDAPRWGIQFFVKAAGIRFRPDLSFGQAKI
jgi:hypothetical protein